LFFKCMLEHALFSTVLESTLRYDDDGTVFQFQHIGQFTGSKILYFAIRHQLATLIIKNFRIVLIQINALFAFTKLIFNKLTFKHHREEPVTHNTLQEQKESAQSHVIASDAIKAHRETPDDDPDTDQRGQKT